MFFSTPFAGGEGVVKLAQEQNLCIARNPDGRLEAFVLDSNHHLHHAWQTAPNEGWSGWERMGIMGFTFRARHLVAASNADGRIGLVFTDPEGRIFHLCQKPGEYAWRVTGILGGPEDKRGARLAAATNRDGRIETVIAEPGGKRFWRAYQRAANEQGAWSPAWGQDDACWDFVMERMPDGRLLVVRAWNGNATMMHQNHADTDHDWTGWSPLANEVRGMDILRSARDGRVHWLRVGESGTCAVGELSVGGWARVDLPSGKHVKHAVLGENEDGRLEVFALDADGRLWHAWQDASRAWGPWRPQEGHPAQVESLRVASNADGRLEVFVIAGGQVHHRWQVERNSGWSAWSRLDDFPGRAGFARPSSPSTSSPGPTPGASSGGSSGSSGGGTLSGPGPTPSVRQTAMSLPPRPDPHGRLDGTWFRKADGPAGTIERVTSQFGYPITLTHGGVSVRLEPGGGRESTDRFRGMSVAGDWTAVKVNDASRSAWGNPVGLAVTYR